MAVELKYFTLLAVGLTYFLAVLWLDPQATTDSRIHRQIFVCQKSTEKIRVAEFTGEVFLQKFRRKKYRYSNEKVKSTLQWVTSVLFEVKHSHDFETSCDYRWKQVL